MAFFVNPGKDWENNLTEEDIAKLEAQGCDVSGLRNRPPCRKMMTKKRRLSIILLAWID